MCPKSACSLLCAEGGIRFIEAIEKPVLECRFLRVIYTPLLGALSYVASEAALNLSSCLVDISSSVKQGYKGGLYRHNLIHSELSLFLTR